MQLRKPTTCRTGYSPAGRAIIETLIETRDVLLAYVQFRAASS